MSNKPSHTDLLVAGAWNGAMASKDKEITRLRQLVSKLEPLDEEIDGFYCLADGHKHRNRYAEALCSARFQIGRLRQRVAELEAELEPCHAYQKEGESPAECIERNRNDAALTARMLAKERKDVEALRQRVAELEAMQALAKEYADDGVKWYPDMQKDAKRFREWLRRHNFADHIITDFIESLDKAIAARAERDSQGA